MDVDALRSILHNAIDDSRFEHKTDRIRKMLNVLDDAQTAEPTTTLACAVSSERFNYLKREEILMATVGNMELT